MYIKGIFNIHYVCTLSSAFVGCYEDCDKMHGIYRAYTKEWCGFYI
jgi:hypothetical protein